MAALTVLSPHFDDAVLSCGGQLWLAGGDARVLTLFAGPPLGTPPPFAQVQHRMWGDPPDANALRRAEDRVALARLGVLDAIHLDIPDAVYRLTSAGAPMYGSEAAIFGALHPDDIGLAPQIVRSVERELLPDSLLLAPLGIGHHVDHQIARVVGERLAARGWRTAFYEELPYVERGPGAEIAPAGWQLECVALPDEALAAKIAAMAYYRTQVPVLYGDDAAMASRIRATARRAAEGGGYAERRWWQRKVEGGG